VTRATVSQAGTRALNGVILLDKPAGITSNRALQALKRLFGAKKAGHCGTLDPFATGLLPICFGEATKFSRFLLDSEKTYLATLRLGETTSTGDVEGEIVSRHNPSGINRADVEKVLSEFLGEQTQIPPMFSALKRDGKPLYALARRGLTVDRAARRIYVSPLRLLSFNATELEIEVTCSKGTYVRVLAKDIGAVLGCGAHLLALRRTRAGELNLEHAYTWQSLHEMDADQRDQSLLPVDTLTRNVPKLELDEAGGLALQRGQLIKVEASPGVYRCYSKQFLGIASVDESGTLTAVRLLATPSKSEGCSAALLETEAN
jgi:tRNA pseudouridine55 synthase